MDQSRREVIIRRVVAATRSVSATVRWIETTPYPTGTKVAEVTLTPIFDDAGRCTELFGTVYDLTEIQQIRDGSSWSAGQ